MNSISKRQHNWLDTMISCVKILIRDDDSAACCCLRVVLDQEEASVFKLILASITMARCSRKLKLGALISIMMLLVLEIQL